MAEFSKAPKSVIFLSSFDGITCSITRIIKIKHIKAMLLSKALREGKISFHFNPRDGRGLQLLLIEASWSIFDSHEWAHSLTQTLWERDFVLCFAFMHRWVFFFAVCGREKMEGMFTFLAWHEPSFCFVTNRSRFISHKPNTLRLKATHFLVRLATLGSAPFSREISREKFFFFRQSEKF